MLRVTGDIASLLELAEATNSTEQLKERLSYLDKWGEHSEYYITVHLVIQNVDLERNMAEICVKFFTDKYPEIWMDDPTAHMIGGLNINKYAEDDWRWSVNT